MSAANRDRTRWAVALLAVIPLALTLDACGQKGPLYLPNAHKTPVPPSPGAPTPGGVPPEATPLPQQAPQQQNSSPQGPKDSAPASAASPAA